MSINIYAYLFFSTYRSLCLIYLFKIRKIQNLMREGGKNTFKKKNIQPIFGKVNMSDKIKKTLDKFLEKLMRATNKKKF